MTTDLTAETPVASTVPEPFGKPSGPGLWHVKGMMLPAYIQHVAHDLLDSGAAKSVSQAIQMAVGIVRKWSKGIPVGGETKVGGGKRGKHPGKIHPDVQAAAKKAMAEWEAKRARAHAQHAARSEHSMLIVDPVDLAALPANAKVGVTHTVRREHVHRPPHSNLGGIKPTGAMSTQEVRNHLQNMHAVNTRGMSNGQCLTVHKRIHGGSEMHVAPAEPVTRTKSPSARSTGQTRGTTPGPAAARTANQASRASKYPVNRPQLAATYDAWGNVVDLATVPHPTAATRKSALKKGLALPHESGSPGRARFPLTNRVLAGRAVKMVQLAKGDKTAIRRYIMRVCRQKGWSDLIPDNWNADGTTS